MTAATALGDPADVGAPEADARWRPAIRIGLRVWAATFAGYLAFGAIAQAIGIDTHRSRATLPAASWPFHLFARGDAGHYLGIARYGKTASTATTSPPRTFLATRWRGARWPGWSTSATLASPATSSRWPSSPGWVRRSLRCCSGG